ncbi:uncharacterized protein LOC143600871 [Bidens hawaiensis]|uniref:uncharacterized protein LOC143600871 n=1 Tax=Bidens hawaiensis TaxID=980011 RepID=UPI00404B3376
MSEKVLRDSLHYFCQGIYRFTHGDICTKQLCMMDNAYAWCTVKNMDSPECLCCRVNNDIDVIEQSPIFDDIIDGVEPSQSFYANGVQFKYGYYLVDSIYNKWSTLVQAYAYPVEDKRKYFKKKQELALKDIEREFGVLKKYFYLISRPLQIWLGEKIMDVVYTCSIILHNMILEDQGMTICQNYQSDVPQPESRITDDEKRQNAIYLKNREVHGNFRHELVEHLWARRLDDLVLV